MSDVQPNVLFVLAVSFALAFVTFAVITTTSFVKISVVLFLVRNALGIQQVPPSIVLYGIALTLTVHISTPIISQVYDKIAAAKIEYKSLDDFKKVVDIAQAPVRTFLLKFASDEERAFFLNSVEKLWSEESHVTATSEDFAVLIPSFMVSELRRAFEIGFLLYLPFIVIDLVITTILLAMGMSQVSPNIISVPFKLLLFIGAEGWSKLLHGLVIGYT